MAVENYTVKSVLGFVEELVVEDDPVYIHWTSFRNTRNINESRQGLMYHISGYSSPFFSNLRFFIQHFFKQ